MKKRTKLLFGDDRKQEFQTSQIKIIIQHKLSIMHATECG